MEIKVIISVDENTSNLIENLTNAILGFTGASVEEVATKLQGKLQAPKKAAVKTVEEDDEEDDEEVKPKKKPTKTAKGKPVEEDDDEEEEEVTKPSKGSKELTADDIRKALADAKHRCGSVEECKKVLKKYGAKGVSDLAPEDYPNVIKSLAKL